MLIKM